VANLLTCSFYGEGRNLKPGEALTIYEVIGQVENKERLRRFLAERRDGAYFEEKQAEAESTLKELCGVISTKTASENFDTYCRYTFMDNMLRGGCPIPLGNSKLYYVYSRKHGDLERDYNYFSMLPEYFSQGNGNFRDVNQNRRCDVFFAPFVGRENIRMFYSLIQLDGYNPLAVEKLTYRLDEEKAKTLFAELDEKAAKEYMQSLFALPEWQQLDAVRQGNYAFLPKELFHFKPNAKWAEGYAYLAERLDGAGNGGAGNAG